MSERPINRETRRGALEVQTLTDNDRELLNRLLGNPLEYPQALREWIPRWLEEHPPNLTLDALPAAAAVVVGMGTVWPFTTAPDGYVRANGAVLLRADAPNLFRLIGVTFNIGGEAATQFRVPNIPDPVANVHWILKV